MKATYKDKIFELSEYTKVNELLKDEITDEHIACILNNEVHALDYEIRLNCKLDLVKTTSMEGRKVYIRGLMYIMGKAFHDVFPDYLLSVNYQLHNAMFCKVDNKKITQEDIDKVKKRMKEIIDLNLPIKKVVMTADEAKAFYDTAKSPNGRFQLNNPKRHVSLYFCEDYYNYLYGTMPLTTGMTPIFEIELYRDGFLVRYPDRHKPGEIGEFKETIRLLSTFDEYEELYRLLGVATVYKFNKKVREGGLNELILLSEALHEKKISILADKISRTKGCKLILIAGPSSSGKTTFAKKLAVDLRLNGIKTTTISVDNYFVERENTPKDEEGNYDFESLEAIDLELFNDHLSRLLRGEEIEVPSFDFKVGTKKYDGTKMKLEEDEMLIIEGIHCLNDKLTAAVPKEEKVKIYISDLTVLNIDYFNRISTTDTRLLRRIVRDHQFRSYDALTTLRTWYSVNRGEEKYIYPYQEEANYMFNSSVMYEHAVLKKYALPLLEEIDDSNVEYSEAQRLIKFLECFDDVDDEDIPNTSLIREFIGGSIYYPDNKKKKE